jgi:hypothetical protein
MASARATVTRPKKPAFFQIDPPIDCAEATEPAAPRCNCPSGFDEKLGKRNIPLGYAEGIPPQPVGKFDGSINGRALARVKARCFGINRNGIECKERYGASHACSGTEKDADGRNGVPPA